MDFLYYNAAGSEWLTLTDKAGTLEARNPEAVVPLLREIETVTARDGVYAAGYVCYGASGSFDGNLRSLIGEYGPPLASFSFFRKKERVDPFAPGSGATRSSCVTSGFVPEIAYERYLAMFDEVKSRLRAGDSYQVNATFRLRAKFYGDPLAWFLERARDRPGDYPLYALTGNFAVCSLSPELFFRKSAPDSSGVSRLTMKPMKGTLARLAGLEGEQERRLREDPKNRAENLMIVDMIRNDAGKISVPGSVRVPALFGTEVIPGLIQMTSTVEADTAESLSGIFGALFPCASITGAPKVRSMEIIQGIEASPRGLYTGAAGVVSPDGSAAFGVAIRTAVFDFASSSVEYGTGSGIVWDSEPRAEWDECLSKAASASLNRDFYAFDSLLVENGRPFLAERHLARLARTIAFFGLPDSGLTSIPEAIERAAQTWGLVPGKMRIVVRTDGSFDVTVEPVPPIPAPYRVCLSASRLDSENPFVAHKTSERGHLLRAFEESPDGMPEIADAILVNQRGELAESTRANIVLELGGKKWTPPLSSGILPGVFREYLLDTGEIRESVLTVDDYHRADRLWVINSVRRWVECVRV